MATHKLTIVLCVLLLLHHHYLSNSAAYEPPDYINLVCGTPTNSLSFTSQRWQGDAHSGYLPQDSSNTKSVTSKIVFAQPAPYQTARLSYSPFTYTFRDLSTPGPKFVRLYFLSSEYVNTNTTTTSSNASGPGNSTINAQESSFSVTANDYITLLINFSPSLEITSPSIPTVTKEFVIQVNQDKRLSITLSPSPNSFAFVNAIQIVSMPDHLYYPAGEDARRNITVVGMNNQSIPIDYNNTSFETAYRLNVGGNNIFSDSVGRPWYTDGSYIRGPPGNVSKSDLDLNYTSGETVPETVYLTGRFMEANDSLANNMTWDFQVDSGFWYLLRLHFCEFFISEVKRVGDRVFNIFINNETADSRVDVIRLGGGNPLVGVTRDYVAFVPNDTTDGRRARKDLQLAMHPTADSRLQSTLLNGLEILKLTMHNRTLTGSNFPPPDPNSEAPTVPFPSGTNKKRTRWSLVLPVIGSVALLITFLGFWIFLRRRKRVDDSPTSTLPDPKGGVSAASLLQFDICRHFSLQEIRSATRNFDDKLLIGVGGFGNVYKGYINNGATVVAVKRLNPSSNQGAKEFFTEIEMLSKLRHRHLVSLIGCCHQKGEMVLVYEYMSRGTLLEHLHKAQNQPLEWKRRLKICIGAAKGLCYLHTGAKHTVIHRDVKSTNILIDQNWVAKVSDFGISKSCLTTTQTHISTAVKGTFGYLDPEYYKRRQLTEKSDVYSFGVVLLEVLCARPAIFQNLSQESVNLAEWARKCYEQGTLSQIVDPNLEDRIAPQCLDEYVEIAFSCLKDKGDERPTMVDVVGGLEFALQLQDTAESNGFSDVDNGVFSVSKSNIEILARSRHKFSSFPSHTERPLKKHTMLQLLKTVV